MHNERKLKQNSVVFLLSWPHYCFHQFIDFVCTIRSILHSECLIAGRLVPHLYYYYYYYFNIWTWYFNLLIWSCFLFMNEFKFSIYASNGFMIACFMHYKCTMQNMLAFWNLSDGLLLSILHRPHSRLFEIKSDLQSTAPPTISNSGA